MANHLRIEISDSDWIAKAGGQVATTIVTRNSASARWPEGQAGFRLVF